MTSHISVWVCVVANLPEQKQVNIKRADIQEKVLRMKIWLAPDREWRAGQNQVNIEWSYACESCHYSTAYYLIIGFIDLDL